MGESRTSNLRRYVERRQTNLNREQEYGPDVIWFKYRSSIRDYQHTFRDLFPGQDDPIYCFKESRRRLTQPLIALDLMSEGNALRSLLPERGLAVALTDNRGDHDRKFDQGYIDVIAGDALQQRTWRQVLKWLELNGGDEKAFHLILERGEGGLELIPNNPELMYRFVENLYEVLSRNDGMMLVQLPPNTHDLLRPWVKQLRELKGLSVAYSLQETIAKQQRTAHYPKLKLIKHEAAPEKLPSPTKQP